jgi:hypothetical protein
MQAPMDFVPFENGFRITFSNSWTVIARRPVTPDSIEIQVVMPDEENVLIYGHSQFYVNSNDLAAVLNKASSLPGDDDSHQDKRAFRATRTFEDLIEELMRPAGF